MTEKHPDKKDEDIAIDFSKLKGLFGKKKDKLKHAEHKEEQAEHHAEHHKEHTEHHEHTEHSHEHHTHAPAHHTAEKKHESRERHEKHEKDKTEGFNIKEEYKNTTEFFKRYATIFLILIPVILTIYLRIQPMYMPATDEWAQNAVYNFYQNQVVDQINQQYPNLPDANKNALVEAEFQRLLGENKDIVEQQIATTSQQFKDRMMYESGNSKYVYLGDIDSYYWLRDARKYINNGTMCDEVDHDKELCYVDTYTMAPIKSGSPFRDAGIGANGKMYAYVIAYIYKIMHTFNEDITIMQASFYVPLLFGIISAILAFLIGKAIAGNLGGLVTSIFITVNPIHLSRTMGSDNDPLNIFFPLLIVLFFIYSFKANSLKKQIVFGLLTGFSISLFAAAWQGWWYMFNFIIAALVIYLGFYFVRQIILQKKISAVIKTKETYNLLTIIASIFFSSAIFITIISGFDRFLTFLTGPLWFTTTKEAALSSYWPNVLVTVAEFNPGSIGSIIAQMGGKLIFFLGMMGILFIMTSKKKMSKEQKYLLAFGTAVYLFLISNYGISLSPITYMSLLALPVIIGMILLLKSTEEVDVKLAILLVIWFVATTYAALKGVRFTLLMVSAFGVAFGITISAIYRKVSDWITSELKINDKITKAVIAVLLLLVLISPLTTGYYTATHFLPSVNDAWYNSLTKIKEESQPDAIINSWWDFGHWFKYLADRRVTLDGSSQGGPPLHWLGKLMVTGDEDLSVGILRMLDCGSNTAFDELNKVLKDSVRSVAVLYEIITLDKKDAAQVLLDNGLTKNEASDVLKYTHCDPPEDFFITSEDMVGKAGVWAHFGSWDFEKSEMYTKVKGKTLEEGKKTLLDLRYGLTEEQADQYYYEIQTQDDSQWITPWPSYMSGVQPCDAPTPDGMMICRQAISNGQQIAFNVNLTNMDVTIFAREQDIYRPQSVVYVTENGTEEKLFNGSTLQFSVILIPNGAGYASLLSHQYLANSIFTRLFYMGGHGLKHFDEFDDQRGVTGGRILVWKVDWEGTDANQVYKAVEASEMLGEKPAEPDSSTEATVTETGKEGEVGEDAAEEKTSEVEVDIPADDKQPAEEPNEE